MLALPEVALASSGMLCWIAEYFKSIVGVSALIAVIMWSLEHIFGMSKLHDLVIKVGVACTVVIAGATFIKESGLTVNC